MRTLLTNSPCLEPGQGGMEEGDCQLGWTSMAQGFQRLDAILRQLMFGLRVQHRAAKRHDDGTWKVPLSPTVDRWYFFCVCVEGVGEWWEQ